MNIVIGSGPAGMACAHALLAQGKDVLVVDAGIALEQEQADLLARLKTGQDAAAFAELTTLQNNHEITGKGIHTKLTYGSDYPYRGAEEHLQMQTSGTGLVPSLATGGFSTVWGAACLPYLQHDIQDWPVTVQDLARHYEAVLKVTGLSAKKDDLTELFPLYTETPNQLQPSSQANRILQSLGQIKESLKKGGITYGSSRLAVGPNLNSKQACVYCGHCLYGCPYGCIYNSGNDLASMIQGNHPRLKFQPNVIVETITESGPVVSVHGYDRLTKAPLTLKAERVFLAAGVVPSSRIILKSLGLYDRPVLVKDSQYFLFPVLSLERHPEALTEALYTLSQFFMEIQDERISPNTVHLQGYTYNDVIRKTLEQKFWFLPWLRQPLVRQLEQRLIIFQGYLHSRHSGHVSLTLHRDASTDQEQFVVKGIRDGQSRKIISKIIRKLGRHFFKLGLFPLEPALEVCLPGRGFHSGGSFPMKANPGPLESDIYGRVGGASRIHVVDASIFPSIPATTITLTAMANAHRIGSATYP